MAHNAYGSLTGGASGHIGGVEWQTSIMAKWLAARGWRVSLITWDEGQDGQNTVGGVRIVRMCRRDAGMPGVRFFAPRWTSLVRALRAANADVYYHNCGEYVTGQVAWWCRRNGRAFVYSVASDPDCDPALPEMRRPHERILYRHGILHAHHVITQTRRQAQMLRSGFGRDAVVIPMPCPGPRSDDFVKPTAPPFGSRPVLWVARICEPKRPDRLLDVAEACPDLQFDLVGPCYGSAYARRILERAERTPNVCVHGGVSRDRITDFYRRAACLCCTSDFEGFPNTFLEAWSHGLPVISTFDPDNLIAERRLGAVAKDAPGLAAELTYLLRSANRWQEASNNARQYYEMNHDAEVVLPRFEQVFREAAARAQTGTGM